MKLTKERIAYLTCIILGAIFIIVAHNLCKPIDLKLNASYELMTDKAEVVSANTEDGVRNFEFFFIEKDDENRHKGIQQDIKTSKEVDIGDKILVSKDTTGSSEYIFFDYLRINNLIYLGIAFLVLLVIFGRKKGLNTVLSLVFTLLSLFYVFLPAVLSGYNVYIWGFMTCLCIVIFTLIVVHGFNKKSLASGLSTILGLAFAWIIMLIANTQLHFTGINSDDALYLKFNSAGFDMNVTALFFTTIIIGALGAVMDVAMSIATSLNEIKLIQPNISKKDLFKSGIEIGKDIMGTMANTLILCYVGSGFLTVVVVVAFNANVVQMFNKEFLLSQFFEPIIGSFGIVATLPITSLISTYLFNDRKKGNDNNG